MADERATGLRRCHSEAIALFDVESTGAGVAVDLTANFRLALPDARALVALAVFFAPEGAAAGLAPSATEWRGVFASGQQGLSVQALETGGNESNRLFPVDNVFGQPSAPVVLPGDTYGWLISQQPDAREWKGVLKFKAEAFNASDLRGKWIARATFTDLTGGMRPDEWQRLADRLYLTGTPCQTVRIGIPG